MSLSKPAVKRKVGDELRLFQESGRQNIFDRAQGHPDVSYVHRESCGAQAIEHQRLLLN